MFTRAHASAYLYFFITSSACFYFDYCMIYIRDILLISQGFLSGIRMKDNACNAEIASADSDRASRQFATTVRGERERDWN